MDHIIQKGIDICFPDGVLRRVAWSVLSKENSESLQLITLKFIMGKRMMGGFYEKVLFSLIFNEPAPSLANFMSRHYILPETFAQKWAKRLKFWKRKKKIAPPPKEIIQKLKEDHQVMFEILNSQTRINMDFHMQIIICKQFTKIKLKGDLITISPHPDGQPYDVYWAAKFLELGLSRGLWSVMVYIKGEGSYDHDYMRHFVNNLIDSIPRKIPENGWRSEIEERGRKNVYFRSRDLIYDDEQTYAAQFVAADRFDPSDLNRYWGYVV